MDKPLEKDSTSPISSKEYNAFFVRQAFEEGSILQPTKDLIDKRFEEFFEKWHRLSVGENKKALQKEKLGLQEIFYTVFYQSIVHDAYLMDTLKIVTDVKKKIMDAKEPTSGTMAQKCIIGSANDNFKPIIDEVFAMPSLVLSAFETSSKFFHKETNAILNKNRTYDIELFKKAKAIYNTNKGKKPKTTYSEALISANNELKIYENENLKNRNGLYTAFLSDMETSFRRQFKGIQIL